MKLYFYYLKDNNLQKMAVAGIRENSRDYAIPSGREFPFNSLRNWNLGKECCNVIQVDSSFYRHSPYIISEKDNLESIPHLAEMLVAVSESCAAVNKQIKGVAGNE